MIKKHFHFSCPRCHLTDNVKNGHVFGWQRYRCRSCGYQFTKSAPKGKPLYVKMSVHLLYMFGLSMRDIARIIGVSAQSVSRWIRKWHQAFVSEVGSDESFFKTTVDSLQNRLDLPEKGEVLVSSRLLPSGARIHVVVQLPADQDH